MAKARTALWRTRSGSLHDLGWSGRIDRPLQFIPQKIGARPARTLTASGAGARIELYYALGIAPLCSESDPVKTELDHLPAAKQRELAHALVRGKKAFGEGT